MSGGNGGHVHRLGDKMFCTREEAEQLAHSAYLLARKEVAAEMRKMALAFEERIKGLEERLVALEPRGEPATVSES